MPEITKSGAKLHLFIVTHKYTDLYFIFSFNNQPQVGKPTWGYDYTTALRRLPRPSSAIIIRLRISIVRHHNLIAPTAQYITMRKTAEERFNILARGWLAYPVTPTHHPSTAEERLYMSSLGLLSLVAERRHSSITRYAKRSVACRDSPRHQPLRAGGTPLPHLRRLPHHIVRHHHRIAHPHRPPSSSYCANGAIHHHAKTAEERFNMLARGWLAYPVTPTHHPSTAEERLYNRHPLVCTLSSQSDGTLP